MKFPKSDPINFTNFSCFLGSMGPKLEPLWTNFDQQWFNRNTAPRTKYFVLEMPFRPLDEQAHSIPNQQIAQATCVCHYTTLKFKHTF